MSRAKWTNYRTRLGRRGKSRTYCALAISPKWRERPPLRASSIRGATSSAASHDMRRTCQRHRGNPSKSSYLTRGQPCVKHGVCALSTAQSVDILCSQHRRVADPYRATSALSPASPSTHAMAQTCVTTARHSHGYRRQSRSLATGQSQRAYILRQVLLSGTG